MADAFRYLSPRQFQKLGPTQKDRYLEMLFEHLHGIPSEKRGQVPPPKNNNPKSPDRRRRGAER
jgi:hypothetical protein